MEKKMIGDVYTISGIDSTAQVREFFNEVVDGNYEKYVAISVQNIKFKFNREADKAEMLQPSETFALNPLYRKIEPKTIEELVDEKPEVVENSTEQIVEEQPEEIVEDVQETKEPEQVVVEKETEQPEVEDVVEPIETELTQPVEFIEKIEENVDESNDEPNSQIEAENVDVEQHTDDPVEEGTTDELGTCLQTEFENLKIENSSLKALLSDTQKELKLAIERADDCEHRLNVVQEGNKKLITEIEEKDQKIAELEAQEVESEPEPFTIETISQIAKELGYEIYFKII